jgi:predicted dinucleotide-binding enzyme
LLLGIFAGSVTLLNEKEQLMNIGILGSGNIGGTLGKKWAAAGHEVLFGVRDTGASKHGPLLEACGPNVDVITAGEAITFGEVVLLAVPSAAMEETLAEHGGLLKGKIIIDATNKIGQPVMNSIAAIKAASPDAVVYRAFNSLGWETIAEPRFGDQQADLFYCGPTGSAQHMVEGLITDVGLRPVYLGSLDQVSLVDAIAGLSIALAIGQGHGRRLAFKTLGISIDQPK